jgi:hypothetical protein
MTMRNTPGHDLEQIQRWMQAVIMHPVRVEEGTASAQARQHIDVALTEADKVVTRSRALTAVERLAIYRQNYYGRLLECLREGFPVLMHALSQDVFDALARGYLQRYPSRSYTVAQLGTKFPHYLAETRAEGAQGDRLPPDWPEFVIDLATLELTFNEVFDGPGPEGERPLDPDNLQLIPPDRWPEARLVGVSCLRLLALRYPVHKYFKAVRRQENPAPPGPAKTYLAVTRQQYTVRYCGLSAPAYQVLRALLGVESVGKAIGLAAETAGPDLDRLANNPRGWFHDWTAKGFFRAVDLPGQALSG